MDNTTTKELAPPLKKVDKVDKVEQYIAQLDDVQHKAMEIAKSHLGTSFNIKRSNGFIEWMKKQKD
jgi:ribosome biogenesis GTPase A